jgi:hypothetical protein
MQLFYDFSNRSALGFFLLLGESHAVGDPNKINSRLLEEINHAIAMFPVQIRQHLEILRRKLAAHAARDAPLSFRGPPSKRAKRTVPGLSHAGVGLV